MTYIKNQLLLTLFLVLFSSGAHSKEQVFLVCKTIESGMAVTAGCINAYNPKPTEVCSGTGGDLCSTKSLEDLCIKVGHKKNINFQRFSSGLGTFKTEQACVDSCMKEYDGKMKKFGQKCLKTVSK